MSTSSGLPTVAPLPSIGERMQRPLREFLRGEGWWFRSAPPHVLGLFRIAFGAFLLFYFGLQLPHVDMFYSRAGLLLPLVNPLSPLMVIFTPPSVPVAYLLFCTFLFFLLLFTLGAMTRVSAAVAFLLYSYYWVLTLFQFGTSFDRLFLFSLLVLVFSGCGKAFSVDMRLRHGSLLAWEPISILPQRLLSVQIAATYLGVGWQKLVLDDWQTGKILALGFVGRWATAPAWWIARLNIPLPYYDTFTWLIKAFEFSIPFGLWSKRYRKWFFLGGALFHIFIAILLAIWWFLPLIPAYILFIDPEEFTASLRRRWPTLIPAASIASAYFRAGTTSNI